MSKNLDCSIKRINRKTQISLSLKSFIYDFVPGRINTFTKAEEDILVNNFWQKVSRGYEAEMDRIISDSNKKYCKNELVIKKYLSMATLPMALAYARRIEEKGFVVKKPYYAEVGPFYHDTGIDAIIIEYRRK